MIRVRHTPHCVEILDYLEQRHCFLIVMERLEGAKDLFDLITERSMSTQAATGLAEQVCRDYFRQIVEATLAIHELGVVHRDLKDENILVDVATGRLKLIDFGAGAFCRDHVSRVKFSDFHGTRVYSPPEWILGQCYYGDRAAVWSLGVLLFDMVYGDIPWEEDSDIVNCRLYSKKSFNASRRVNNGEQRVAVSDAASSHVDDLIRKCLHINQHERIKLEDILKHTWLRKSFA